MPSPSGVEQSAEPAVIPQGAEPAVVTNHMISTRAGITTVQTAGRIVQTTGRVGARGAEGVLRGVAAVASGGADLLAGPTRRASAGKGDGRSGTEGVAVTQAGEWATGQHSSPHFFGALPSNFLE